MDSTIFTLNIPYGAKSKISKSPNREQFSVSRNAIFLLTISRLICYVFICSLAQLYISFIGLMFIYQISQYIFQSVTFTKIKKPFFSSELVSPPVASELAFLPQLLVQHIKVNIKLFKKYSAIIPTTCTHFSDLDDVDHLLSLSKAATLAAVYGK